MAKQRRRDAAVITAAPEGSDLLADLAQLAENDPAAIGIVRKLVEVVKDARSTAGLLEEDEGSLSRDTSARGDRRALA